VRLRRRFFKLSVLPLLPSQPVVYNVKVSGCLVGVLSASASLGRLNELIEAGFRVTDVSSTWENVIVEFARGDRRTTVELGPEDARSLVYGEEPTATQRVAARRTR
jgi:hypothetical protein